MHFQIGTQVLYLLGGLFRIKVPFCLISNVTSLPGASFIISRTSAGKVI